MENLNKCSDDRLVALYVSGSDEAFDALLERHKENKQSWIEQTDVLHNLRDAVSRRIANGGVFSDFSQESIDRFFFFF